MFPQSELIYVNTYSICRKGSRKIHLLIKLSVWCIRTLCDMESKRWILKMIKCEKILTHKLTNEKKMLSFSSHTLSWFGIGIELSFELWNDYLNKSWVCLILYLSTFICIPSLSLNSRVLKVTSLSFILLCNCRYYTYSFP